MKRSIFVVLVLMAAIAAYGNDRRVRVMDLAAQSLLGPVCFPGDPCGWPGVVQVSGIQQRGGPVCLPGDPCGPWPGVLQAPLVLGGEQRGGPMCFPGDPCGPGGVGAYISYDSGLDVEQFGGPMCFPGDPCGPQPSRLEGQSDEPKT